MFHPRRVSLQLRKIPMASANLVAFSGVLFPVGPKTRRGVLDASMLGARQFLKSHRLGRAFPANVALSRWMVFMSGKRSASLHRHHPNPNNPCTSLGKMVNRWLWQDFGLHGAIAAWATTPRGYIRAASSRLRPMTRCRQSMTACPSFSRQRIGTNG